MSLSKKTKILIEVYKSIKDTNKKLNVRSAILSMVDNPKDGLYQKTLLKIQTEKNKLDSKIAELLTEYIKP